MVIVWLHNLLESTAHYYIFIVKRLHYFCCASFFVIMFIAGFARIIFDCAINSQ